MALLIRQAKADAWESLQGHAAVAVDYRLTAGILTRFAEDLEPGGDYSAAQYARGGFRVLAGGQAFRRGRDRPLAATAQWSISPGLPATRERAKARVPGWLAGRFPAAATWARRGRR
jgi:hypothetical protein